MEPHDPQEQTARCEAGLSLFRELVETEDGLAAELEQARDEFEAQASVVPEEALARELREWRCFEWFLFERPLAGLGTQTDSGDLLASAGSAGLAVDGLWERWLALAAERFEGGAGPQASRRFRESLTGVFEVLGEGDAGLSARDLAGLRELEIKSPVGATDLAVGDLIVGRLYPAADGAHELSPAAASFRSAELAEALRRDLDALRGERPHAIMRLSQLELERMFWGPAAAPEDAAGELRRFLAAGGLPEESIEGWCRILARTPRDAEALISGVDDAAGRILEQLAFHSSVDLGRARELLLQAWSELSGATGEAGAQPPRRTPAGDPDVRASLEEFDRDRAAGLDVETSFRELLKRLELDDEEGEFDSEAPDFPGVVGAMVEEFLWETEASQGPTERRSHEGLRVFGRYASHVGVFENLGQREVLAFAAFWLPESRELATVGEARRMVRALTAFAAWSDEQQGLELLSGDLGDRLERLERNLPRAVTANAALPGVSGEEGELFEYRGPAGQERARVGDFHGSEREVRFEPRLLELLEPGDLFRGHTAEDGNFVVSCCYPPEALGLRPGAG